jgi:hypothetical protein
MFDCLLRGEVVIVMFAFVYCSIDGIRYFIPYKLLSLTNMRSTECTPVDCGNVENRRSTPKLPKTTNYRGLRSLPSNLHVLIIYVHYFIESYRKKMKFIKYIVQPRCERECSNKYTAWLFPSVRTFGCVG